MPEHGALLGGELGLEAGGVQHAGTLLGWQAAQIAEGMADGHVPVWRHLRQGLPGAANLLALLRRKPLKHLVTRQDALTHLGWRVVELVQAVDEVLLLRRGQTIEARLTAQSLLLIPGIEVLVLLHPLWQVLVARGLQPRLPGSPTLTHVLA